MDKTIKHICKCGSQNVEVLSVVEGVAKKYGKIIKTATITYVCTDCENSEEYIHYLYLTKTKN